MDSPLVSIITVCLNAERFLSQAIESVISQTYPNIEYIVIDGGSRDRTLDIIDQYKAHIKTIISEPDNGIYNAMNKGVRIARGEIIGLINSDDYYAPDAVEIVVSEWRKEKKADVICGNVVLIHCRTGGERVLRPNVNFEKFNISIPHPSAFVTSNCYKKLGSYNESYRCAADGEFFYRLARSKADFLLVDRTLAFYRSGGFAADNSFLGLKEKLRYDKQYIGISRAVMNFLSSTTFLLLRTIYRRLLGRQGDRAVLD